MAVPVVRRRRRAGGGPAWTPVKFGSSLYTWWRESGIASSGSELTAWNADAASAVVRNLNTVDPASPNGPTVTTNGGESAVVFTRADSESVRLTGTSYDALTAGVVWAIWKQSTTITATQDIFSFGSSGSGTHFFALRLTVAASQLYPGYTVGGGTNISATARLTTAAEEANNASWRQVPANTVCVLACEIDSVGNTSRIFFANSTTMRTFSTFIDDADDNSGLQMKEALGSSGGARGDFLALMTTGTARNRMGIGCGVLNNDTADGNFTDGTVFEVGIASGTLGTSETAFLAYLMKRRGLKS